MYIKEWRKEVIASVNEMLSNLDPSQREQFHVLSFPMISFHSPFIYYSFLLSMCILKSPPPSCLSSPEQFFLSYSLIKLGAIVLDNTYLNKVLDTCSLTPDSSLSLPPSLDYSCSSQSHEFLSSYESGSMSQVSVVNDSNNKEIGIIRTNYIVSPIKNPTTITPTHIICPYLNEHQKMLLDSLHIPLYSPMWLYSCIDNKRYIDPHTDDPWNQLLFQPAKGPCIPEMRHFVVSITGFSAKTKPTRDQIKCAIDILGCCYMGPLSKNHTTHLICNNSNRYFASLFVDVALVRKQKMQAVGLLPYTS